MVPIHGGCPRGNEPIFRSTFPISSPAIRSIGKYREQNASNLQAVLPTQRGIFRPQEIPVRFQIVLNPPFFATAPPQSQPGTQARLPKHKTRSNSVVWDRQT